MFKKLFNKTRIVQLDTKYVKNLIFSYIVLITEIITRFIDVLRFKFINASIVKFVRILALFAKLVFNYK